MANRMKGAEKRTARVSFVMEPSYHAALKKLSEKLGRSINDTVNFIVVGALERGGYGGISADSIQAEKEQAENEFAQRVFGGGKD